MTAQPAVIRQIDGRVRTRVSTMRRGPMVHGRLVHFRNMKYTAPHMHSAAQR